MWKARVKTLTPKKISLTKPITLNLYAPQVLPIVFFVNQQEISAGDVGNHGPWGKEKHNGIDG